MLKKTLSMFIVVQKQQLTVAFVIEDNLFVMTMMTKPNVKNELIKSNFVKRCAEEWKTRVSTTHVTQDDINKLAGRGKTFSTNFEATTGRKSLCCPLKSKRDPNCDLGGTNVENNPFGNKFYNDLKTKCQISAF